MLECELFMVAHCGFGLSSLQLHSLHLLLVELVGMQFGRHNGVHWQDVLAIDECCLRPLSSRPGLVHVLVMLLFTLVFVRCA